LVSGIEVIGKTVNNLSLRESLGSLDDCAHHSLDLSERVVGEWVLRWLVGLPERGASLDSVDEV
jgi:hypothetical protein